MREITSGQKLGGNFENKGDETFLGQNQDRVLGQKCNKKPTR